MDMARSSHRTDPGARGRAALSNRVGRFEAHERDVEWDGWDIPEDAATVRTVVSEERPRSVITRNTSPDVPFDRSINPYRGCEHGCIYCFARPTHAYLGLSPGLDFETQLVARPGAAEVLERELRAKRYEPRVIAMGTNTDPYQPVEGRYNIMRQILEVLYEYRHPVGIVTKGTLIERDVDVLSDMARLGLVHVGISVTTLDAHVSRKMEPRVPLPKRRIQTIQRLSDAGVPVRVMVSPVLPALTDHELEHILRAGKDAGAMAASWIMLRLPLEVAPLFEEWVKEAFPDRAERILNRVKDVHGGRLYDAEWGLRMTGQGVFADLIGHRFELEIKRLGLSTDLPSLRTDLFRRPVRKGDQMSLF